MKEISRRHIDLLVLWNIRTQLAKKMASSAMPVGEEFQPEAAIVNYFGSGGMPIMASKITVEQLTKFILYSEWLILIDGHPLNNMDIKWLRERIRYVGQVGSLSLKFNKK
ncbi:unnamed protein product [Lactuca saligna]|uniref:Uncharacterized protein n=1 Tax=Lactuca saligna TaxID=75948 RepID=A0AA35YT70_LACSI|nr:unnamed protein product [Lactuca saligna]